MLQIPQLENPWDFINGSCCPQTPLSSWLGDYRLPVIISSYSLVFMNSHIH